MVSKARKYFNCLGSGDGGGSGGAGRYHQNETSLNRQNLLLLLNYVLELGPVF